MLLFNSINYYPFFVSLSFINKLIIIPTIHAKDIPDIVNEKSPLTNDRAAPPKPNTNIVDATIMFLGSSKSTLFLINTFNPLTAINPYKSNDTPPKT